MTAKISFSSACDAGNVSAAAEEITRCLENSYDISLNVSDKLVNLAMDPENNAFLTNVIASVSVGIQKYDAVYAAIKQGAELGEIANTEMIDILDQICTDPDDDFRNYSYEETYDTPPNPTAAGKITCG